MQPILDFSQARKNMVEGQIRPNRITHQVLIEAMRDIPREAFVPDDQKAFAYCDENIPLDGGRVILSPLTTATLLQAASITENDSVLIVGCGTGYLSVLVAKIAGSVIAIDDNPLFTEVAEENAKDFDILNITFHNGPLTKGYPKHAPYSLIIIEGAVQDVPARLTDQLEDEGRLITILDEGESGNLVIYKKIGGKIAHMPLFSMGAPLIHDFAKQREFSL